MARKRRYVRRAYRAFRRRAAGKKIPGAVVIGIAASPSLGSAVTKIMAGDFVGAQKNFGEMVGISASGAFDLGLVYKNWTPAAIGLIIHKAASMSGLNRALRKIPYVQV